MQVLIVFGSRASIYSVGTHSEGSTQKATMESQNWFQFRQESFFTTNCALNKIASCKSATINVQQWKAKIGFSLDRSLFLLPTVL